ncbi:MAG: hypothetical protein ACYDAO_10595 [Thermoplasmataceae archaeon]
MNIRDQMEKMGISESEIREWERMVTEKRAMAVRSCVRWRQSHPDQWKKLKKKIEAKSNGRRSVRNHPRIAFDFFDRARGDL